MYAVAIDPTRAGHDLDLLTRMFELRRQVLKDSSCEASLDGDLEFDIYDTLSPTYLLAFSEEAGLVGSVRLLPSTGPTLLRDRFAALLGGNQAPRGPTIMESSRFCVAGAGSSELDDNGLNRVAYVLYAAIIETMWNLSARSLVMVSDLATERGLGRAGWPVRRLASPQLFDGTMMLPGMLHGSSEALDCMYRHANLRGPVLRSSHTEHLGRVLALQAVSSPRRSARSERRRRRAPPDRWMETAYE